MAYLVENIAQELKAARNNKGLSQRKLGAKVGVPQSHISKIENGTVDLKTSSLIELARALDLELMLVPRALIPAVQGLQRGLTSRERSPSQTLAESAAKDLERTRKAAQQLTRSFPDARELQELANTIKDLQNRRLAASPAEQIRKLLEQIEAPIQAIKSMQKAQDAVKTFQKHRTRSNP
ncbi:MAG: helix-turn-helix transcriptional regulator [Proteobacteria bacterium]|nr:helix-turn-helix transcriptional regulator [Pseudomonadota bacterium]